MFESLRWKIPLILVLLVAAAAMLLYGKLRLGFDLKGGVELRYQVKGALTEEERAGLTPAQIAKAKRKIQL